jgi:hypothetical protein
MVFFFFQEGKPDPNTLQFNGQWKLGDGGIRASELTIIGLIHISRGLWIPILQLSRHIMPRWEWSYYSQPVVLAKREPEENSEMLLLEEGSGQSAARYKHEEE